MGWKDRDYHKEPEHRPLLNAEAFTTIGTRVLATSFLAILAATGTGALAFWLGWLPGADGLDVGLASALAGLVLGVASAAVVVAELWLDTVPVKQLDTCAVAAFFVFLGSGLLVRLGLGQVHYAVTSIRGGSPLLGLELLFRPTNNAVALWLGDPSSLCLLAAPFAAVAGVRGDDDERPLRAELRYVLPVALALGLVTNVTIWLLGGSSLAPTWGARIFFLFVVPPLLAVVVSVGARLGAVVRRSVAGLLAPRE